MTDSSEGAQYIGIAYNKDTSTESTDPTDYEWTRIRGNDGSDGMDGFAVILSNESQSIPTSNGLKPLEAKTYGCEISVYQGINSLSPVLSNPGDGEFSVSLPANPTGITLSQTSAGNISFSVTPSQAISSSGNINLLITIGGVETPITKSISYSAAMQGDSGISATNVILSNENHTFTATSDGHAVATSIDIGIAAYYGSSEVATTIGTITNIPTGMEITIQNNGSANSILTVSVNSSLSTLNGIVQIPVTAHGISFEKQFTYSLSKAGSDGSDGNDATAYWLVVDTAAVVKNTTGTYSPAYITLTGKKQTGTGSVQNYSGRFQIFINGSSTASYTSNSNEASKQFTIPANTSSIRCVMYTAGGTSVTLDEQMIPVVSDGNDGENGNGIKNTSISYQASTSGTTIPTGQWSETIPTVPANQYLWTKVEFNFDDNSTEASYSVSKMGNTGKDGADGTSVTVDSTSVTYQKSSSGTTPPTGTWSTSIPSTNAGEYLWAKTEVTYSDGKSTTSYSVSRNGSNGAAGKGISSVENYYLATSSSSGVTASTSGWTTTIQNISSSKKYLWNYEKLTYTDGSSSSTTPCIIGTYGRDGTDGADGSDGVGISSIQEYYQVSSSNSTAPSNWVTTPPTMTATNKYLWNYERITYTNSTSKDTDKRVIGVYGDKGATGATGIGISSVTEYYAVSSSNTTAPSSWQTSVPTMTTTNRYLWNYEKTTYTDNSTKETAKRVIGAYGNTGATGSAGKGISSITNYYLVSSSASGVTTSTSGWSTTPGTTTATNKYLWNYEKISYTDSSSTNTTPHIIGTHGSTGSSGTGYTVFLTNEAHTFPGGTSAATASSVSTNVIAYKNTAQISTTITKIGSTSVSGNQSGVATGITGLTATVTNNGSTTTSITFNASTSLKTTSGTVAVVITADGKSFTKNFSFSIALKGATGSTGTAAKSVDITATSQIFKSTDGGATFTPDTIKLTPVFQGGISFSKWQYSTNGGSSWTDASNGSHGLTISSGVLSISKSSDLFTASVTALSFKCISNNASYFDTITILRLYDVDVSEIENQLQEITTITQETSLKVDEHTQSINSLITNTKVVTKDGQTISAQTAYNNTLDTLTEHTQTISNHETKLDEHTGEIESTKSQISSVSQSLNSYKQTVSSTYATKNEVSTSVNSVTQDLNSFKVSVGNTYATKDSVNTISEQQASLEVALDGFKTSVKESFTESGVEASLLASMALGEALYKNNTFTENNISDYTDDSQFESFVRLSKYKCTNTTATVIASTDTTPMSGNTLKFTATNWNATNDQHVGGVSFNITPRYSAKFIGKFVAKIPSGYSLECLENYAGTNPVLKWIGSTKTYSTDNEPVKNSGTGEWEEYYFYINCDDVGILGGSESNPQLLYNLCVSGSIKPSASAPVTWQMCYAAIFDVTNVSGFEQRISSAESQISQNTEEISSLVSKTQVTIEELDDDGTVTGTKEATIQEMYSQLKQTISGVQVSINESITEKIDDEVVSLESKIAAVQATADGLQANITNIQEGIDETIETHMANYEMSADQWEATFQRLMNRKDDDDNVEGISATDNMSGTVNFSVEGIKFVRGNRTSIFNTDQIAVYNGDINTEENLLFGISQDNVVANRLQAPNGADFKTIKIKPMTNVQSGGSTFNGIAFVKSGGDS